MAPPLAWLRRMAQPGNVLAVAVAIVLCYVVVVPLAIVGIASLRTPGALPFDIGTTWTFSNYAEVVQAPGFGRLVLNTVLIATASMAIAFTISLALAWLIERTDLPFANAAFVLVVSGLGIPAFIGGIAWVILANPSNGLLNELLRQVFGLDGASGPLNIYSFGGFVFVQGVLFVPATFLLVAAAFRGMDARLEEAAAVCGAGTLTTLRRVTLPLLAPALVGAFIYMFITAVESFDIPLTIGLRAEIPVLSSRVFLDLNPAVGFPNYAFAAVHGVMLLGLGLIPLIYYNRMIGRAEEFATISGRGGQRAQVRLGVWKWPALAFIGLYVMISVVLPSAVMFWTSIQPFYALPSVESLGRISFDAYADVFTDGLLGPALKNTIILVLAGGLLAMGLAFLTSWVVVRSRVRGKAALDVLAFMPHVFPAPVLALALLLIYIGSPLPIYGTIWIVVIAVATRYLGLATRFMNSGITSVHREMEEAASVSGASWRRVMRRILLPLVMPSFANGFVIVALLAIQQLAMPLILASSSNRVLSTLVWGRWGSGDTAAATALAMVMLTITMTIVALGRRFGGGERSG